MSTIRVMVWLVAVAGAGACSTSNSAPTNKVHAGERLEPPARTTSCVEVSFVSKTDPSRLPKPFQPIAKAMLATDKGRESGLKVCEEDGLFSVYLHETWTTEHTDIMRMIAGPGIAPRLRLLQISSEEYGANGTRNIDMDSFTRGEPFPRLEVLFIEPTHGGGGNRAIVTGDDSYDENGVIGRIVDRAPRLRVLTVASAPDKTFFTRANHPLEELTVYAGYDQQNFIRNLASSRCFPRLRTLEFVDYSETYIKGWEAKLTPVAEYQRLFVAAGLPGLRELTLSNAVGLGKTALSDLHNAPLARQLTRFETATRDL